MCTIYKLKFSNNQTYIGQTSQPIEDRVSQHILTKGQGCPKLYLAWQTEEFLGYEILEKDISTEDIDSREVYWISQDKPALNTLPGGRVMRGLNHPRSKYTEQQVIEVVRLYLNTRMPYTKISEATGVEYTSVHDILKRRSHEWVWEELDISNIDFADRDKRGEEHTFWDIDNNKVEFSGAILPKEKELNLSPGTLYRVAQGNKSRNGWSLNKHPIVKLTDPLGEERIVTLARARQIIETEDDLSYEQIRKLIEYRKPRAGWCIHPMSENLDSQ